MRFLIIQTFVALTVGLFALGVGTVSADRASEGAQERGQEQQGMGDTREETQEGTRPESGEGTERGTGGQEGPAGEKDEDRQTGDPARPSDEGSGTQ